MRLPALCVPLCVLGISVIASEVYRRAAGGGVVCEAAEVKVQLRKRGVLLYVLGSCCEYVCVCVCVQLLSFYTANGKTVS